jgi:hypothetical protein
MAMLTRIRSSKRISVLVVAWATGTLVPMTFAACGSDDADGPAFIDAHGDASATPYDASAGGDGSGTMHDGAIGTQDSASDARTDAGLDAQSDAPSDAGGDAGWTCSTTTLGSLRTIFPQQGDCTGATVEYTGCTKTSTATGGVNGSWGLNIAQESSFYRVSKAGWRTTLSAEIPAGVSAGATAGLQLVGSDLTGYDATKAHVLLTMTPPTGGCTKNGNTVSLVGHPEAVIHYVSLSGADVGSSTNTDGIVWITNIDASLGARATFTLTPAVAGCNLAGGGGPSTGRVPLFADTVSAVTMGISK